MKEFQKCSKEMLEFIEKSPTCFHVIDNLKKLFREQGFIELDERKNWEIHPGQGYFVTRNESSIIALRVPDAEGCGCSGENIDAGTGIGGNMPDAAYALKKERYRSFRGFHISAAHSDSPAFKVKEAPEIMAENVYLKLNTEKYGGMILSTWLDRALSVAGRIAVKDGNGIETRLVNIEKDLLVIPNVAVHLNREMNKGVEYNPQTDMLPLYGDCDGGKKKAVLMKQVARAAGVRQEDILGHDLFLYPREKGRILGEKGEFVLSPRLDDLQCVFASAKGFLEGRPAQYINVCAVFDNEEVGSGTKQGADSTFLEDTLWRVSEAMGFTRSEFLQLVAGSFLISADNAHAVHPNHPEKYDPTNRPYLNGGIVIKYHGSQKYATDAVSAAKMKSICEKANAPYQTYANRSDIAGGSTLGNISTAHVSVSSVDIGLPQLAMHSAVETAGIKDTKYAVDAFQVFFGE